MNEIADIYSLSPAQQGLLFHSVAEPESRVYYQQLSLTVEGALDPAAFQAAWNSLLQRHNLLRTAVLWEELDSAFQVVLDEVELPLSQWDWRGRNDIEDALAELATAQKQAPFDLSQAPLLRVVLVRLDEARWHFIWTFHHILMDGWSVGVAMQEWLQAYTAHSQGQPLPWNEAPDYKDYISWLAEQDSDATLDFWRQQLAGIAHATPLPDFACQRTSSAVAPYAEQSLRLSAETSQALQEFARRQHLTLNTLIQGAWALLLGRHAGLDQVLFGVTLAGRPEGLAGVESMVGLFINTLPLHVSWQRETSLQEWLQQLQQQNSEIRQHAYLPLAKLRPCCRIPADRPLFDSIVVFENFPIASAMNDAGEQALSFSSGEEEARHQATVRYGTGRNHFPLSLIVIPGAELELLFSYQRSRFNDDEIRILLQQLHSLLQAMMRQIAEPIAALNAADAAELEQVQRWGRGASLDPLAALPASRLEQCFSHFAQRHPEMPALVTTDSALNYAELEARANQFSHFLHAQGIGASHIVALALPRTAEFIIAMLGTLKAGAAYLPLDLKQPPTRLGAVLQDSGAKLLIASSQLPELELSAQQQRLDWPPINAQLSRYSSAPLATSYESDAAAYVIYTSGSTGQPKGVVVPHASISGYLHSLGQLLQLPAGSRQAMLSTVAADLGHTQLFGALCSGGTLVLVDEDTSFNPAALAEFFHQTQVDTLKITPSHLAGLLDALAEQPAAQAQLLPRHSLIFGGEALTPALLARIQALAPALRLINHYGPSEATVGAVATILPPAAANWQQLPLGQPLAGRQLLVLDDSGQPAPIGVAGELFIGGALADGYLQRPDLTAERFVQRQQADGSSSRFYRSGDRVRWSSTGQLLFLGRQDNQIKIRGNRVELGEVEAQIRALSPHIRQVIARLVELPGQELLKQGPRLLAYVVASESLSGAKLANDLAQRVPDYMVPAHFITLDAIPLNANGKVDIHALPLPQSSVTAAQDRVLPRTALEQQLAEIWQSVLKREVIGVHDNFFSLGGDSILILQVIARANQQGLKLTPKQLFEHRSIAEIAALVAGDPSQSMAEGMDAETLPSLPLSAGQYAVLEQGDRPASWRCVALEKPISQAALRQALQALIQHHGALRLRLGQNQEGVWQQQLLNHAELPNINEYPTSLAELKAEPTQTEAHLAPLVAELNQQLDPSQTRLLQVALLKDAQHSAQQALLLVAHPLALDEASWPLLLADLNLCLNQVVYQRPIQLAPGGGKLGDWLSYEQAHAHSDALEESWEAWLQHAGNPVNTISGEIASAASQTDSVQNFRLDAKRSQQLKQLQHSLQLDWSSLLAGALLAPLQQHGEDNVPLLLSLDAGRPALQRLPHHSAIASADLDPSQLLGPLSVPTPIFFSPASALDAIQQLQHWAKELGQYPQQAADYGVLRYLSDNPYMQAPLGELPKAGAVLNFHGDLDQHRERHGLLGAVLAHSRPAAQDVALRLDAWWQDGQLALSLSGPAAADWRERLERQLQLLAEAADAQGLRPQASQFPLCQASALALETQSSIASGDAGVTLPNASNALDWRNIEDVYPLSPMQQGMLLHTLLQPNSGVYLMQQRYRWDGPLDAAALEQAWAQLLQRHPMLRTAFWWQDEEQALQCVYRQLDAAVEWHDLRALEPAARQQQLEAVLAQERVQGFAMDVAPLTRLRVFRLEEKRYTVVRSFHHILTDAWCFGLLMEDLLASYQAELAGEPLARPQARAFRHYMSWLMRQDLGAAQRFWLSELAGFDAATPLVVDHPPQTLAADVEPVGDVDMSLSIASTQRLQQLCQQHELTPNTWIQGAWSLLLARYSGNAEVLFGVTVAGRPTDLTGVEHIIGLFINSLPLRVQVDDEQAVIPWLQQLLAHNAALRDYEFAPLVEIQRCSEIARGSSLFDSLVVFENAPLEVAQVSLKGFSIDIEQDRVHTNFPVTVVLYPGDRLGIRLSYDRQRFDEATMQRMLGHLAQLLENMLAQPEAPLGSLELLTPAERRFLLEEINQSAQPFELETSYARQFTRIAASQPRAIAAVCGGEKLSYAELERRSSQLAQALVQAGAAPDTLVALAAARGLELLTMMIATLKAGAAFQALDINHPPQRLAELLELSGAPILLLSRAQQPLLDQLLPALAQQPRCLISEAQWQAANTTPASITAPFADGSADQASGDRLAYVIFTSGSTGTPKGVMVEQRGMLNNIYGKVPSLGLGRNDRIAQTASPAFDISIWQFLAAPLLGATVHILPDEIAHDPARLLAAIEDEALSIVEAVPSMIQGMLQECVATQELNSLRWLLPTGEALPSKLCQQWLQRFPGIPLMNAYGPAECSDDVAFHPITRAPVSQDSIPIGRPTANNQLFILDAALRLQPVGVPGEIVIAGSGVGRGYLNDAERSRQAFIPHPFQPGARCYRSGDIGRVNAQGEFEYLGRRDQQVKVRGHRIELGEIEHRLQQHPAIHNCAVLALPDAREQLQLVAFYRPSPDLDGASEATGADLVSKLRQHLAQQLAGYMIPAQWIALEQLPLSANGKIDRRALSHYTLDQDQHSERSLEAPRGASEQALARIWRELLGSGEISRDDHFFNIGGHSLLATQLMSRIQRQLGVQLPLRTLFEHPTLAEFARAYDAVAAQQSTAAAADGFAQIPRVARDQALPLSFAQQRLWFVDQLEGPSAAYNLSIAVKLSGRLNLDALRGALALLLQRHESLRTAFVMGAEEPEQRILQHCPLPLSEHDLRPLQYQDSGEGSERARALQTLLDAHSNAPFDLTQAPLMRVQLVHLGMDEAVLQLTLHHIITDAWSMAVLVRDAINSYQALAQGAQPLLPELPIQYADYAAWQRSEAQQLSLAAAADYWRQQLSGVNPVLNLPCSQPRPAQADYRGDALEQELDANQVAQLKRYGHRHGATLFMVLLNAFNSLIQRASGRNDFIIGTDLANRQHPALEQLIGFFVNVLPLRARLAAQQDFAQRLASLREHTLGAYEHQQMPFDKLVEMLQPPRQAGVNPLVQLLFVLQNTPQQAAQLPGLQISNLESGDTSSKFDLAVFAEENPDGSLKLRWVFRQALFNRDLIAALQQGMHSLLDSVLRHADAALQQWDWQAPAALPSQSPSTVVTTNSSAATGVPTSMDGAEAKAARKLSKLGKLKSAKLASVSTLPQEQVRTRLLAVGTGQIGTAQQSTLPLIIEPRLAELDPVQWAEQSRDWVEQQLRQHGGLLFRGFKLPDATAFEAFAQALEPSLYGRYGDLPKNKQGRNIYHSTPYPEQHMILFHNESSHMAQWPRKQWFYCETPAREGGCTPIVDCREVYRRLPTDLVQRIEAQGLRYVRHFTEQLDVRWQDFFKTDDPAVVEEHCRQAGMHWQWLEDGNLRTEQHCPGIIVHPLTGEKSFFNQVQLHHECCLEAEVRRNLHQLFGADRLPRNVYFGDGSVIPDAVMDTIDQVYEACAVRFPWQQQDVVMLDNMLVAHARDPFVGERKICVAMGAMVRQQDLNSDTAPAGNPALRRAEGV